MSDPLEPAEVRPRPSASAGAARAAQLGHIKSMAPLERMALALALGRRCRQLADASRVPQERPR